MSDIIEIPAFLRELLIKEYPNDSARIFRGFVRRPVTLRANTLKATAEEVALALNGMGVSFSRMPWYEDAFLLDRTDGRDIAGSPLFSEGKIYLQSLSSMLPPLFLAPKAGESVLDMTAAPGGKTTQLAALSGGRALITACEKDRVRFRRLKFNLARQGAAKVNAMQADALKLDGFFRFDKILLDAPCSGSGTLAPGERAKISPELVKNCARTQKALLKKGLGLLKDGGVLLYSTCSVLKEENEEAVAFALSEGAALLPLKPLAGLPLLPSPAGTVTVCPDETFEGFFLAMLQK